MSCCGYLCAYEICGKEFINAEFLSKHVMIHTVQGKLAKDMATHSGLQFTVVQSLRGHFLMFRIVKQRY